MSDIDEKVENQGVESQANHLDQVKRSETQHRLVFLLEIVIPIEEETANDPQVESDDIGAQIRYVSAKQHVSQELNSCADDADDAVSDETRVILI